MATARQTEDSDALVVRLYEAHGARGSVRVRFGVKATKVVECNLMEAQETAVPVEQDNSIHLHIRPFQVRSFLVWGTV